MKERLEVDQDIAAADQVDAGKRGILGQVLAREGAQIANGLSYLILSVGLDEKPLQAFRANLGQGGARIGSGSRLFDRRLAQVRGEDLHRCFARPVAHGFCQHDRNRIGLLAGGTARHPYAQRILPGLTFDQLWNDPAFENPECLRLTEKARDMNQDILIQGIQFGRVPPEKLDVFADTADFFEQHAPGDAPVYGAGLVVGEIRARGVANQQKDFSKVAIVLLWNGRNRAGSGG